MTEGEAMKAISRISLSLLASAITLGLAAAPGWAAPGDDTAASGGTDQVSAPYKSAAATMGGFQNGAPESAADNGGYVPPVVDLPDNAAVDPDAQVVDPDAQAVDPNAPAQAIEPTTTRLGATKLPASYDARTAAAPTSSNGSKVVRNQNPYGTCWAFASSAAAQASLVRNGFLTGEPTTTAVPAQEISPANLVNAVYNTGTFHAYATTANKAADAGGNYFQTGAAWSHLYGAVPESTQAYGTLLTVPTTLKTLSNYHMRNAYYLPGPYSSKRAYVAANVTAIKNAVYTYGTVATEFTAGGSKGLGTSDAGYYNSTNKSYYNPTFSIPDHGVSIIGWDDNYAAAKFNTKPAGNGAFLIKNSWGAGTYDYFWLSYRDTTIGTSAVFDLVGASGTVAATGAVGDYYTKAYANDELGYGDYLYNGAKSQQFANTFTANPASVLRAVQLFSVTANTTYKVSVYLNANSATSPVSGATAAKIGASGQTSISGTLTYAGYQTVKLPTPVTLGLNQKFSIVVTLTLKSGASVIPVERAYSYADGAWDTMSIGAGQSFLYSSGWKDIRTIYATSSSFAHDGNVIIMGLVSPGPSTLTYNANGGTAVNPASKAILPGNAYGTLPTPTRTGQVFTGWYTAASGGTKVTSATAMGTTPVTIYAHWKPLNRLWGNTQVDTAIAISNAGWATPSTPGGWALLATGKNFPDAMAGGPLASALSSSSYAHAPILLTMSPKAGLEQSVINELTRLKVQHVIILGGTSAISQKVQDQLTPAPGRASVVPTITTPAYVERVWGQTQYDTAAAIANRMMMPGSLAITGLSSTLKPTTVFLTNGKNYPDALAASPIAAKNRWPILFTPPKGHLAPATATWLRTGTAVTKVWVLGGTGAVPAQAVTDLAMPAASVTRLWGQTQYDTVVAINNDPTLKSLTFGATPTTAITIATGRNFPDAIAGGVFAAMKSAPLFLIDGKATKANTAIENAIVNWKVDSVATVYVFGGTGAVTDKAVNIHVS